MLYVLQSLNDHMDYMQGFFWPDFIAEIRLCSQSQKVYFFHKMWQKISNKKKKKIFLERSVLCVFYLNFNSITSNKVFYDFVL